MAHEFKPDHSGLTCDECPCPERHPIHHIAQTPAVQAQTGGHRDGATFQAGLDESRLNAQARRVWRFMASGEWNTLAAVSAATGGTPEASVSARLRDFRKPEYGGHEVERRRRDGGAYEYRLRVKVHTGN